MFFFNFMHFVSICSHRQLFKTSKGIDLNNLIDQIPFFGTLTQTSKAIITFNYHFTQVNFSKQLKASIQTITLAV